MIRSFFLSIGIISLLFVCIKAQNNETSNTNVAMSNGAIYTYKNISICPITGKDKITQNYQVIEKAMNQKKVKLHESGNVNELEIDNFSPEYVFVMAGDIVKGGKQDRTIGSDMILEPNAKKTKLPSFCVEANRWTSRGNEEVTAFSSSTQQLSNKNLKIAAKVSKNQSKVWSEVSEFQTKAGTNVKSDVKDQRSASSLQLTLENKDLRKNVKEYVNAMRSAFDGENVIGFVLCINGKVSTVEIFANHNLFSQLKDKLLESAANEAVSMYEEGENYNEPSLVVINKFIEEASKGKKDIGNPSSNIQEVKITNKGNNSIRVNVFHTSVDKENPLHTTVYNTEDVNLEQEPINNHINLQTQRDHLN